MTTTKTDAQTVLEALDSVVKYGYLKDDNLWYKCRDAIGEEKTMTKEEIQKLMSAAIGLCGSVKPEKQAEAALEVLIENKLITLTKE